MTVDDASTMAQIDPQTCDVGVQALELAAVDEGFRKNDKDVRKNDEDVLKSDEDIQRIEEDAPKTDEHVLTSADEDVREVDDVRRNDEDAQKTDEVLRGIDDPSKGRKRVADAKERNNNKRMVKDSKPDGNKGRNDKRNVRRNRANKGMGNDIEMTDKKVKKESQKSLRKRKCRPTKEERDVSLNNSLSENHDDKLHGRTKVSNAWLASSASQEDDTPLLYSKTPGRLRKKSDESNRSLREGTEKSNIGTRVTEETAAACMAESSPSEKQSEFSPDTSPQLPVVVEDIGEKQEVNSTEIGRGEKNHKKHVHDDIDATVKPKSSQQRTVEEQQHCVVMRQEEKGFLSLNECQKRLEEEESTVSKKTNLHNNESTKENGQKSKKKPENKRKKKSKEDKSTEKKVSDDNTPVQEKTKTEDEGEKEKGGRVLRRRTKKRSYGVEIDPCKGQRDDSKTVCTETAQKPYDNEGDATVKKCKSDDICLKGHEPAMSPEANQLAGESELSSREIVPLVDEPPASQGVTSRSTANDASQQPETEMQGELNEGNNRDCHGVRLTDYNSVQGCSDLKYNQVTEVREVIINQGCDHRALEEVKSEKSSGGKKAGPEAEGKNNKNVDVSSTKRRKCKQAEQNIEDIDNACVAKRQDSDAFDPDNDKSSTRQKAKSTFQDTGHSKPTGSRLPAEPSVTVCENTTTTLKEKVPNDKTAGKKR